MTRWLKNTFEPSHGDHLAILPMEGVRGFAVFLVFLVHFVTLVMPWLDPATLTHGVASGGRNDGAPGCRPVLRA